jgi:hypothetical protein
MSHFNIAPLVRQSFDFAAREAIEITASRIQRALMIVEARRDTRVCRKD